jgi:2-dehydropantoate 2-reductase
MFPSNSIFGGMAFICANRRTYSIVAHLDYGLLTIGHISDDSLELEHASALWAEAKVPVKMSTCLRASRWEKLCWTFPFNGVSCAMGGITVDHILRDDDLRKLAEDVMREVVKLGNADLAAQGYQKEVLLQEEEIVENMFRLTSTMGAYRPSTMIDLLEGRRMEVNIFTTPVRIASRLGAQCTVLDSVTRMVCAHQRLRDNKREGRTSVFLQKYA